MDKTRALDNLALSLHEAMIEVDRLIMATPTSDRRNALTEINIHLQQSADLLRNLPQER